MSTRSRISYSTGSNISQTTNRITWKYGINSNFCFNYTIAFCGNHNKATFNNISAISLQSVLLVRWNRRNPPTCRRSLINFVA
jgi:hypothetical protein